MDLQDQPDHVSRTADVDKAARGRDLDPNLQRRKAASSRRESFRTGALNLASSIVAAGSTPLLLRLTVIGLRTIERRIVAHTTVVLQKL